MVEKKSERRNCRPKASYVLLVILAQSAFIFASISTLLSCMNSSDLQKIPRIKIPRTTTNSKNLAYIPSSVEEYIMNHAVALGYDNKSPSSGCAIWNNINDTVPPEIYRDLQSYATDLEQYNTAIHNFEPIPDLLKSIQKTGSHDMCASARPHPDGIEALFPSKQLSLSKSGFMEPITPPMRDHRICEDFGYLMSIEYLVHDFEAMCRTLKPHSKRILIDMGASLKFHEGNGAQPLVTLLNQYEKFGFTFDHIYGFEITETPPKEAYDLIPEKFMTSFHWINVGVTAEEGNKFNPLHSILTHFDKDDFIVVKLDIDTTLPIEVPLARQLLEDNDGIYTKLVDHFYFEHHVQLEELKSSWTSSMGGSVKESLDLFHGLREKGIPAHFWP